MRLDTYDLDEIDLTLCDMISFVYGCGVSRSQAERLLSERIRDMFDALDDVGIRPEDHTPRPAIN